MNTPGPGRGLRRHLEGWPVGVWLVFVCALSAALVVPRKVEPLLIPPPIIDRVEQRERREAEQLRAERARAGLPLEVRSVGEAFRRVGQAGSDAAGAVDQFRNQLRRLAAVALERHGDEKLLELRALQGELFARALRPPSGGEPAPAAHELGGSLFRLGSRQGWFWPSPTAASADELRSLFQIYWAETLGWEGRHPYAPTLNEWRVYYRFLLARPAPDGPDRDSDLQRKLGYVAALAQHDREYPAHLAQGVLLYQIGAYAESAAELGQHLSQQPDGRWALRARNYLAACGAALSE
jgi:hypothetical protein